MENWERVRVVSFIVKTGANILQFARQLGSHQLLLRRQQGRAFLHGLRFHQRLCQVGLRRRCPPHLPCAFLLDQREVALQLLLSRLVALRVRGREFRGRAQAGPLSFRNDARERRLALAVVLVRELSLQVLFERSVVRRLLAPKLQQPLHVFRGVQCEILLHNRPRGRLCGLGGCGRDLDGGSRGLNLCEGRADEAQA